MYNIDILTSSYFFNSDKNRSSSLLGLSNESSLLYISLSLDLVFDKDLSCGSGVLAYKLVIMDWFLEGPLV